MYLTSSGIVTGSLVAYVRDILDVNFHVEYERVPYMEFGCDTLISDIRKDDARLILETKIQEVIQRLNRRNNLRLILEGVSFLDDRKVGITLSLGNVKIQQVV